MKNKFTLFALLAIIFSNTYGQYTMSDYYLLSATKEGKPVMYGKQIKKANVSAYEIRFLNDKGEATHKYVYELNKAGNTTYMGSYNRKNVLRRKFYYAYTNDTLLTQQVSLNKKGDTVSLSHYRFNNGKMISSLSKKGKRTFEYLYAYNDKGNRTSYVYKRNGALSIKILYDYDSVSGKLAKQSTYNKKNKLVSVVNYECNYQGEVKKDVSQSKVCMRTDALPGGGFVVYNDYTNPKGKLRRSVATYSNDSNLMQVKVYDTKNKLVSGASYIYDNNGNCVEYTYSKNNKKWQSIYSYNDKLLLSEYHNKKEGKITNRVSYSYSFTQ
ncbi:MAG: hypothetical protein ACK44D_03480 [Bacteroidia bacterium]|jgi:hypothetical protein